MRKLFLLVLILFCINIVAADNDKNPGAGKVHSPKPGEVVVDVSSQKVLTGVANSPPKIFADKNGNAIVFAKLDADLKQKSNNSGKKSGKDNAKFNLVYNIYVSAKQKWLRQLIVPLSKLEGIINTHNYQFLNSHSKTKQILFVTSKVTKVKNSANSHNGQETLWSIRKLGLTGSWAKPQSVLTFKGSLPTVKKICNNFACVIAWQTKEKLANSASIVSNTKLQFKWFEFKKGSVASWSKAIIAEIPSQHRVLQYKIVLLDSTNIALVWLAAVVPHNKKRFNKIRLKIFVRMRISNKWLGAVKIATLGTGETVRGLGDIKVVANSSRKILVTWNEKLVTAGLRSVYYYKKWSPVATVYKDNPDVSTLSASISEQGRATLFWQQKYGKYSHVFYSEYSSAKNNWTIPLKLDKNPKTATLKQVAQNLNDELVAVWLKNFSVVQLALIDNHHTNSKSIKYLQVKNQGLSKLSIALFDNKLIRISWLTPVKNGFEVWVQTVSFSQGKGEK